MRISTSTSRRIEIGTALTLIATLLFSIVYIVVHMIRASSGTTDGNPPPDARGDYTLMLVQCILGLLVMFLPSVLERRLSVRIPNSMHILFYLFLFCAIYLGEVRSFYYRVPHWDTILHAFSGCMLGALGFLLVRFLNESERVKLSLSPFFVALFAFCFALSVGALWEIYEYTFDGILGLNMQKFRTATGHELVGHAALSDTMKDLIVDCLSALAIAVVGYLSLRGKRLLSFVRGWVKPKASAEEKEK